MKAEAKQKSLTKAELKAMNILWDKGEATVYDILEVLPEPKPAYTTVLTVMQVHGAWWHGLCDGISSGLLFAEWFASGYGCV